MKLDRKELARFLWMIAAALLIAGYLRYTIQGELLRFSKILLIGGGVVFVAALVVGFPYIIQYFSKRSSRLGTNTAILTVAVLAILVFLNFVGYRHHKRFDLTTEKLYTLSDQTRNIVRDLKQDVTVLRFEKTPSSAFDDLMGEYKNLSPHFKFQNVDPQQKPEVAQEYGAQHMGDVIVAFGTHNEHVQSGARGDVGEEDIIVLIHKATTEKVKEVCFASGHGEKGLADSSQDGYSQA